MAEPPATPGEGESARVAAADAVGIVASSVAGGERSPMAASYSPTVTSVAPAFAVAPSLAPMFTSGEGDVAKVSAADADVAVASPATLWRMYERKEDMRSLVGGTVITGTGSVLTSMPTPVVEVTVAVALATVSTAASKEGEASRIVAVEVPDTDIVVPIDSD